MLNSREDATIWLGQKHIYLADGAACAYDLVLFSRQRLCCRTTSHKLERLRRAASRRVPCTLLVSRLVLAARAHAERSREHARSGSSVRCSGTLTGRPTLAIYPAQHRFVRRVIDIVLRTLDPFLIFQRETLIFLRQGAEIFTPGSPVTHVCEKGLMRTHGESNDSARAFSHQPILQSTARFPSR